MFFRTAALAAILLAVGAPALAATTYTDKAAFLAAVGAVTSNDLDSAPRTASHDFGDFVGAAIADQPMDPDWFGFQPSSTGAGVGLLFTPAGEMATFTFDAPIFAFGLDILGLGFLESSDLVFTIGEVEHRLMSADEGQPWGAQFAGFVDRAGFRKITISASGFGPVELDNVVYASAGGVPEPSAWAMMLLGFAGLGLAMRRRQAATV